VADGGENGLQHHAGDGDLAQGMRALSSMTVVVPSL